MSIVSASIAVATAILFFGMTEVTAAQTPEAIRSGSAASAPMAEATPGRELNQADLEAWLDGLVPYALRRGDMAGAVVLVLKGGKSVLAKGYGFADLENGIPMDPRRTVLGVGSVSKLLTWTAVMQLVEQGKLDLDRNINDYLDFKIPDAFGKPISMRNLMTHTAGFAEMLKQYTTGSSAPRDLSEYLKAVPSPERIYPPGKVPAYSNYGTNLAGYIVERVSGEPFAQYVERHITKPLGMESSSFQRPRPEPLRKDMAHYYDLASSGIPLPANANDLEPTDWPAGGFASTAEDMSRFMRAHLDEDGSNGAQILQPSTIRTMHAPTFVPFAGAQGVALGFFRYDYNGHRIIMHGGDLSGFHTDLELLPDDGVGFFMSVNSDGSGGGLINAAYQLRAALFRQFMDRYFPAPARALRPTVATASEHAHIVAGEYQMSRRPGHNLIDAFFLTVRVAIRDRGDGTIETPALLSLRTARPQRWREVAPFVWQEVDGTSQLNMDVVDGKVREWLPDAMPSAFVLEPIPFAYSAQLNLPLFGFAATALLLETVLWPVAAVVRRRHHRQLELKGRAAQSHKFMRYAVLAGVAFLLGWAILGIAISADILAADASLDPWIRLVQFIGLLSVPGAVVAIWNMWLTCSQPCARWIKTWSIVIALALVDLVWFSFASHLISVRLNY